MKIYIAHSKELDYVKNLYQPIRNSNELKEYDIILPHEEDLSNYNSREFYKSLSVIIAEVTSSATGLGIELGWAYDDGIPIYCVYKKNKKLSSSLKSVTSNFIEYESEEELINIVKNIILEVKEN